MQQLQTLLRNFLLAFALISIGFALGKNSVKPEGRMTGQLTGAGRQVAVYYLHSTFRCVTCNTIENMTRVLLDNSYSNELAQKRIIWIEEDFQQNEALAKQFEVIASCVVVAEMNAGIVTNYNRLDDVWSLMTAPDAFNRRISEAINNSLNKLVGPP